MGASRGSSGSSPAKSLLRCHNGFLPPHVSLVLALALAVGRKSADGEGGGFATWDLCVNHVRRAVSQ